MKFDFSTANRIIFGSGSVNQVGELVEGWGERCLIVKGRFAPYANQITDQLSSKGIQSFRYEVEKEPTIFTIDEGLRVAREVGAEFVISIGGGSTIDTGKALSALLTNPGGLLDYLEVVGSGKPISLPPLPFLAIPTTAGTGSEVTRNAVIGVPEKAVKVSMRSIHLLPRIALVDPQLTLSLPPEITASTGMDGLTQLIEPFVSNKSNWMIDSLCRDGISRMAQGLPRAFANPSDLEARTSVSYASLLSGLALANAGLGAVHGFAGPLGGMFDAPHGAICARLLPQVVRMNIHVLQTRASNSVVLDKYLEVARIITGYPGAELMDGVEWLDDLCLKLKIPHLAEYGVSPNDFGAIIQKSVNASSMKGNPVILLENELRTILEKAF